MKYCCLFAKSGWAGRCKYWKALFAGIFRCVQISNWNASCHILNRWLYTIQCLVHRTNIIINFVQLRRKSVGFEVLSWSYAFGWIWWCAEFIYRNVQANKLILMNSHLHNHFLHHYNIWENRNGCVHIIVNRQNCVNTLKLDHIWTNRNTCLFLTFLSHKSFVSLWFISRLISKCYRFFSILLWFG